MNPVLRVIFWLVVAASLLANAVVLGLFLRFGDMRGVINGGGGGFANLPSEIKQEFRDVLAENRRTLRVPLRELGQARRAMFDAASARPYDRAAVEAAMERVREASAAAQVAGQALLLEAFDRAASR
ncbi:MAG: periplasmic heavy metal sensor [Paracoccaceae bacterium]